MSISEHPLVRATAPTLLEPAAPPRWTALLYRLPGANGRARTAVWRTLRDLDALKLGQGTWAVPHRTLDGPDLTRTFAPIHDAGGEAWARTVDGSGEDDERLQERLVVACDRLWDGFFNELDRVEDLAERDPAAADAPLTALRATFAATRARDLLGGSAAQRAGRRLRRVEDDLLAARPTPVPERSERHRLDAVSVVLRDGRTSQVVVRVVPAVDAVWERAFNAFEAFAYGDSLDRVPLRHSTFTLVSTFEGAPADRRALAERIARFESYVGA